MRLAVAAGATMALILAALLSIGTAPTPAAAVAVVAPPPDRIPAGAVFKKHLLGLGSDNLSPPGCLRIVGKPSMLGCLPCPPLWLGGASVFCAQVVRPTDPPPPGLRVEFCPDIGPGTDAREPSFAETGGC